MTAREAILARIRAAVGETAEQPVPMEYRRRWDAGPDQLLDRLADRLKALDVTVLRTEADAIAHVAEQRLLQQGIARVLVPTDLPPGWRPQSAELVEDAGQSPHELDRIQGIMTGCALAIAETGTIVLDAGEAQGRRAVSLVPDYYLCVVRCDQVVGIVPEAIARLSDAARDGRPITFISGPSATADIELSRVVGVHGPRTLDVILAG